jgi:hypothetical protein
LTSTPTNFSLSSEGTTELRTEGKKRYNNKAEYEMKRKRTKEQKKYHSNLMRL